ncbi:MAG: hypothetical protein JWO13_3231 [Acidobacteriales bacterium]|nr:hypothetical protein [Terriglobales bacterium]
MMMIALYVVLVLSVVAVLGVSAAVFVRIRKRMKSKLSSEETQQIKAARDREAGRVIEMRKSER